VITRRLTLIGSALAAVALVTTGLAGPVPAAEAHGYRADAAVATAAIRPADVG
jgi:hypothetical protein